MARVNAGAAILRLRTLSSALKDAPAAAERAAAKVFPMVYKIAGRIVGAHVETGLAAETLDVVRSGTRVDVTMQRYLDFHRWWPFRGKRLPRTVIDAASRAYAAEVLALLGHGSAPAQLAAADVGVEDVAAARKRADRKAQKPAKPRRKAA